MPRKVRRGVRIASLTAAIVMILIICGFAAYLYLSVKGAAGQMYHPLPQDKSRYVSKDPEIMEMETETVENERLSPFSVLLLGVDKRASNRGRSDTMMVITVNPGTGKVLMFSIPRDTRTRLVRRGFEDKINHAYAYDGIAGSVETVEHFLDLPIDYYLEVNMEGFQTVIDLLDGVEVDNPFPFRYEGRYFPKGLQRLNGELALKYSRMRYDDPRGDFGRNERQRQILKEVIKRAASWNHAMDFPELLNEVGRHVKTNLTFDQMRELFMKYRTRVKDVVSMEIKGNGTKINGIYYFQVNDRERLRIHDEMKAHLLETPSTVTKRDSDHQ